MGGSAISSDSSVHLDLIGRVAAGDADALAALYQLHGVALFRLARRLTTSVEDAEDVLHDLFVGLPESIHKYDARGSLIGWLKRVVLRLALMRLRAERRRREVALPEGIAEASTGAADVVGRWDVERVMATLPADLRAVLVLRQTEGYSHQEISALLGITPGASRVRLSRAITLLKAALRGRT
jgi:RNA polymerase sigma-70 factor (ECF subfamily)